MKMNNKAFTRDVIANRIGIAVCEHFGFEPICFGYGDDDTRQWLVAWGVAHHLGDENHAPTFDLYFKADIHTPNMTLCIIDWTVYEEDHKTIVDNGSDLFTINPIEENYKVTTNQLEASGFFCGWDAGFSEAEDGKHDMPFFQDFINRHDEMFQTAWLSGYEQAQKDFQMIVDYTDSDVDSIKDYWRGEAWEGEDEEDPSDWDDDECFTEDEYDEVWEYGYNDGFADGCDEGHKEGYDLGMKDAEKQSRQDKMACFGLGFKLGYECGTHNE